MIGAAARTDSPTRPGARAGFLAPFLERARREPDRPLVGLHLREGVRRLSHGDLLAGATRHAALLDAEGIGPGEVVFVSLKLSPDLLFAFLGAALRGCVPSLLPYPTPKQDAALFWASHEALFRHTGAALLVTYPENRDAVARHVAPGLIRVATPPDMSREASDPHPHAEVLASGEPRSTHDRGASFEADLRSAPQDEEGGSRPHDRVACLQHSSGTTGLKKGVPLSDRMILAQVEAYAAALGMGEGDGLVSWLPLYHDMGFVACWLTPLVLGCPVDMLDPFEWLTDPLRLLELAAAEGASFAWLPNFAFQHLVNGADDRRRVDLGRMRAFIDCSEPCKPATVRAFAERFAGWGVGPGQVQVCYAMAETTFAVTQTPLGEPPAVRRLDRAALEARSRAEPPGGGETIEILSAGRPVGGTEVAVRGPDGGGLPDGAVGEITVRCASLFGGYYRREGRSADLFRDGFYRTGDLGFLLDGELHVLGRGDDLIIVQGRNVFAHEIEHLVSEVAGVKAGRAVAFGRYSAELGSEDVIVVAEAEGGDADRAAIRRGIRAALESTIGIVPGRIAIVEPGWLVKTTSGKVSRGRNRDKYLAGSGQAA